MRGTITYKDPFDRFEHQGEGNVYLTVNLQVPPIGAFGL